MDFNTLAQQHKTELLESVLRSSGSNTRRTRPTAVTSTCLDCDGSVYDTDKVHLAADARYDVRDALQQAGATSRGLECAVQGAEFLRKYGQ